MVGWWQVGGNSNIFSFHPENIGEDLQFDEHILSNGLVKNHQLGGNFCGACLEPN